jgi:serine/threonine protein kinase
MNAEPDPAHDSGIGQPNPGGGLVPDGLNHDMPPAIQNFHLTRQIGEGGFGEVWLGETITGKPRAVKWVRRERFERPGLSAAGVEALFRMEFAGVQHFEDLAARTPELISILHVGKAEADNAYYYVMPLADNALPDPDGGSSNYQPLTLQRWLDINGTMDWENAVSLLAVIARGAAALHRAGLRHGDISSDNILWVEGKPVLGDPGLTSLENNESGGGSPGFSDPAGQSGKAGDVFALGRLLYHAVSGIHPAESFPALPPDRMSALPVNELANLLDRCCDPDPAQRFQNADELLAALPSFSSSPVAGFTKDRKPRLWAVALLFILLAGIGYALWSWLGGPPNPGHAEVKDGLLTVYSDKGSEVLWRKHPGTFLYTPLVTDLDGDGTNEVLCPVRHVGERDGGRLVVYNADGTERWHFDATLDFQNFRRVGKNEMLCSGVLAADWDGLPGKEIVMVTRNSMDWFPSAQHFLSSDGQWLATYWHPGHIHPEDLRFVRETPDSPLYLAFKGLNNDVGASYNSLPKGKQKYGSVIGLLDPRVKGHHEAPPGRGELKGQDGMSLWYRKLTPQWLECRTPHTRDVDDDGINEIVVWAGFGGLQEFTDERVNLGWRLDFKGNIVSTKAGDGHRGPASLQKNHERRRMSWE